MTIKSLYRRVAPVLGTVLLVALVAPFVIFAVPQLVGADFGFVVLSGSMGPAIAPGDVVIVDAGSSIAVGDVITFDRGSDVSTTHRVVDVVDGAYQTKGDANENVDAWLVQPDQVLGRVVFVFPFIGHVIWWARTPVGMVALVGFPIVALLALELRDSRLWPGSSPEPEERSSDETPNGTTAKTADGLSVSVLGLELTLWSLFAFTLYAGWVVVDEWQRTASLRPITTAVLAGVLMSTLLLGATVFGGRTRSRGENRVATEQSDTPGSAEEQIGTVSEPYSTDGGESATEWKWCTPDDVAAEPAERQGGT